MNRIFVLLLLCIFVTAQATTEKQPVMLIRVHGDNPGLPPQVFGSFMEQVLHQRMRDDAMSLFGMSPFPSHSILGSEDEPIHVRIMTHGPSIAHGFAMPSPFLSSQPSSRPSHSLGLFERLRSMFSPRRFENTDLEELETTSSDDEGLSEDIAASETGESTLGSLIDSVGRAVGSMVKSIEEGAKDFQQGLDEGLQGSEAGSSDSMDDFSYDGSDFGSSAPGDDDNQEEPSSTLTPKHMCRADADRFCPDAVDATDYMSTVVCLSAHYDDLSDACRESANKCPVFNCASDADKFCQDENPDSVPACLRAHLHALSDHCLSSLDKHVKDAVLISESAKSINQAPPVDTSRPSGPSHLLSVSPSSHPDDFKSDSSSRKFLVPLLIAGGGAILLAAIIAYACISKRKQSLNSNTAHVQLIPPMADASSTVAQRV